MIRAVRNFWLTVCGVGVGVVLGYLLMRQERATQRGVRVPVQRVQPAPPEAAPPAPPPAAPDDFTRIDGIGPAYARALYELGINTFAGLAQADPDEVAARIDRLSAGRIRREDWIGQAAALSQTRILR
jgi:predicted flap endonuclease-1-like 5' DNA nuclease